MCSRECVWLPALLSVNIIYFFINGEKMNLLKKQFVKRNYHKETLKITIDMA